MERLKELGYVTAPTEHKDLLSRNLHGLNHKSYTFKEAERHGRQTILQVGIYSNYYIHYIEDISHSPLLYDMHSHDIPKAIPVKIENLIRTAYFDYNARNQDNSALSLRILSHLNMLGWDHEMPLKEFDQIQLTLVDYYLEFEKQMYEVTVQVHDDNYLIYSIHRRDKSYCDKVSASSKRLPKTTVLMKAELSTLCDRKEKLIALIG
jgi:hypothetical protein